MENQGRNKSIIVYSVYLGYGDKGKAKLAKLKALAAQAGLSLSAYVRQKLGI